MPDDTIRWTVSVSKGTDRVVRSFLAEHGVETDDLSTFIEDAVKWRVLDQTINEARNRFADMASDDVEALIDEAVTAARRGEAA